MRTVTFPDNTIPMEPHTMNTFSQYLETKAEWQRPLLEHLKCTSKEEGLNEFLSSGKSIKFTLASDGSTRNNLGAFKWEIAVGCEIL